MFDISLIPNRDTVLEGVYTEFNPPGKFLSTQNVIPTIGVNAMIEKIPDYTVSVSDWTGVWTVGSEIRATIEHLKGWSELMVQWYAIKDQMSLEEYSTANPSKDMVMFQTFKNNMAGFLSRIIKTSQELQLKTLLTTESNYINDAYHIVDVGTSWKATGGTALTDILAAKATIEAAGLEVTHMFCPTSVLQQLRFAPEIIEMYKYTGPFEVTRTMLQDLLMIPNIIDFNGYYWGKPTKQVQTPSKIWNADFVVLAHLEPIAKGTYPTFVKAVYSPVTIQDLGTDPETLVPTIIGRECSAYNIMNKDGLVFIKNCFA